MWEVQYFLTPPSLTAPHPLFLDNLFVVVQSLSHVQLFVTPRTVHARLFLVFHYLPEFAQTDVHLSR